MGVRTCFDCIWYDREKGRCILRDEPKEWLPFIGGCRFYNKVPSMLANYVIKTAETTGVPSKEIIQSDAFRRYMRNFKFVDLCSMIGGCPDDK